MTPERPIVRYHGGKWLLADWIIAHFPPHRTYVEAFGGGGSVLLRKPPSHAEVYNDLDGAVVNLFRVLRDPATAEQLRAAVAITPYARAEFVGAYEPTEEPVEWARRCLIRAWMGFGSAGMTRDHRTGFRANTQRQGGQTTAAWNQWPDDAAAFTERLRSVIIEQRPALEVIDQQDDEETLFYCDPPYVFDTRSFPRGASQPFCYRHEMTDDEHCALAERLREAKGMVVLSGYHSPLYDELYQGWRTVERRALADSAHEGRTDRVEVLWINYAAGARLSNQQEQLFAT